MQSRISSNFTGVAEAASHALDQLIERGADAYDRKLHLPRLLPLMPAELADDSPAATRTILKRLARALRHERNRGRAGHWTYDLNRHIALCQAYAGERRRLRWAPPP